MAEQTQDLPPIPRSERTTSEIAVQTLTRSAVDTVFGVPGVQLDYFVDALAQRTDEVRYVSCRHEQGAAHMADGYARSTGRTGVLAVVPGPGTLNATTGLATAFACSSPVLCVSANLTSSGINQGWGLLHEVRDQEAVLRSVTKQVVAVRDAADVSDALASGVATAHSGRPRPVAVSIPEDLLQRQPGRHIANPVRVHRVEPDQRAIEQAAALLSKAERPVIIAGGGAVAADAAAVLAALGDSLRAPVVTTSNGRGAISDRAPWALTSLGGREVLPQADAVLVVGSRGLRMNGQALIQNTPTVWLNVDADDFGPPREPTVSVLADARLGLIALGDALGPPASTWTVDDLVAVRARCEEQIDGLGELAAWVRAVRLGMADDAILVSELTQTGYLSRVAFPVYRSRGYLSAGYQGTLGYGVPTAIGAQVARPSAQVVSISGDGGFAYGMAELLTAVAHGIPATFVVFDDGAYGNVLRTQLTDFDGRQLGTRLHNPNFADLGAVFGVQSHTATNPDHLTDLLRGSAEQSQPSLLHVPVGRFADPGPLVREGSHASED